MKIGTKSVLFGAHAFWLHPWFVAWAWWKLYGFPFDPRLWFAFFLHDVGYWGKPNMDGPEGEKHPELGARLMHALFDRPRIVVEEFIGTHGGVVRKRESNYHWLHLTLFHSRFYAKQVGRLPSRLCAADKLASYLTPWWIYLPMVKATGEIQEYMAIAGQGKYLNDHHTCSGLNKEIQDKRIAGTLTPRAWQKVMAESCRRSAMMILELHRSTDKTA